jgi:hypothetical protein
MKIVIDTGIVYRTPGWLVRTFKFCAARPKTERYSSISPEVVVREAMRKFRDRSQGPYERMARPAGKTRTAKPNLLGRRSAGSGEKEAQAV